MNDICAKIEGKISEFLQDMQSNVKNGNKAVGRRARKSSLEIEKMLKEYRKLSVQEESK